MWRSRGFDYDNDCIVQGLLLPTARVVARARVVLECRREGGPGRIRCRLCCLPGDMGPPCCLPSFVYRRTPPPTLMRVGVRFQVIHLQAPTVRAGEVGRPLRWRRTTPTAAAAKAMRSALAISRPAGGLDASEARRGCAASRLFRDSATGVIGCPDSSPSSVVFVAA
jgi:hypothetical protein